MVGRRSCISSLSGGTETRRDYQRILSEPLQDMLA